MTRSVLRLTAVLLAALLALSGCAGLPTSGPVEPGLSASDSAEDLDVSFRPNAPQAGASAEQIVEGFIRAAAGPQNDWEVARLYLAEDIRATWQPETSVTVDRLSERTWDTSDPSRISLSVAVDASVDDVGVYQQAEAGTSATFTYRLTQQADGQWRIAQVPDGILLDDDLFDSVFRSFELMYFDPTWTYLVPDLRWFPSDAQTITRVSDALVNGSPSPWLEGAVVSAFPQDVTLTPSVPVVDGVAQAELSDQALNLPALTVDRMYTQFQATLATANVSSLAMLVDGVAVTATRVTVAETRVDTRALVLSDAGFGFLVAGELTAVSGLSSAIEDAAPLTIETTPDLQQAAVLLGDGHAARVTASGAVTVVDERGGMIPPTIDPFGAIWSVPASDPAAVRVSMDGEESATIAGAWGGASGISTMEVSRDGARVAAVLEYSGRTVVAVAAVLRGADGAPTGLGEMTVLSVLDAGAVDLAWVDEVTLGVITGAGEDAEYVEQLVGGPTLTLEAPDGAATLAGSNLASAVRLLGSNGDLYVRRSSGWNLTATGVRVLAVQQGMP